MVTSNSITFVRSTRILKHNTPLLALVPLRVTGLQSVVSVPLQPGHTLLPGYHTLLLIAFDVTWRGTGGNSLSAPPLLHLTCLQIYPGVSKWQHTLLVTISRAPTSYELHFLFNCGRHRCWREGLYHRQHWTGVGATDEWSQDSHKER